MKDTLTNFITAKLAKEKGFDLYPYYSECYKDNGERALIRPKRYNKSNPHIIAPTQSLLQRWLREKYNIHLYIRYSEWHKGYQTVIEDYIGRSSDEPNRELTVYTDSKTYEQSLEKGLREALKLIKL